MSDPRHPAITSVGTLDPLSRHRIVWFVIRLSGLAALAFGPCLAGARPAQNATALLSLACSIGGIVSMVFAKLGREPLGRGSLNGWDEALAFVAMSRLAHYAI